MKNIFHVLMLLTLAAVVLSCGNKDEEETADGGIKDAFISGRIKYMPQDGDYVIRLTVYSNSGLAIYLSSANVSNEGDFHLKLPESVDEKHMFMLWHALPTLEISNPKTKTGNFALKLYKGYTYIDDITLGKLDQSANSAFLAYGMPMYADQQTKVTGIYTVATESGKINYDVDMNLAEGWNWRFETIEVTEQGAAFKMVTGIPQGCEFLLSSFFN